MVDIGVVHLVRATNGMEPFQRFLDSYLRFPAGCDHTLIVVYKGFVRESDTAAYSSLLRELNHQEMHIDDEGYDVTAYYKAANRFPYRYFCFLNSFSCILDRDWLSKLARYCRQEGVGLVGATGSWETPLSSEWSQNVRPPTTLASKLRQWLRLRVYRYYFASFPNAHIRTNTFMIARDQMLRVRCGRMNTKLAAYRFESGKTSLTRQIHARGLKTLVVGKDGQAYDVPDWPQSNTFRRGDQYNLLVADNRTSSYLEAAPSTQLRLAHAAWGDQA